VVLEHWWCLHKTGDSTRPELTQSKALASQDLLSAPRTRPTRSHRGPAVVDQSALHVWGTRLQKFILRKRPCGLTFGHRTTNPTGGSQAG
jgi:hypothetical protein